MIKVEFKGYVNQVRTFDWGTVYNVSHNQVRKNHQGEWETVGRDYFSVVGPAGFVEDDQVEVVGKLKTKLYDKKDGSGKGISLEVRADTMVKAERGGQAKPATVSEMQEIWPAVKQIPDDSVPF
jgi:hypothetical protein